MRNNLNLTQSLIELYFDNVNFLQNIQLLLGVKYHNVLLRIVFELVLSIIESRAQIVEQFRNLFTVDIIIKIFEDYEDANLKIASLDMLA